MIHLPFKAESNRAITLRDKKHEERDFLNYFTTWIELDKFFWDKRKKYFKKNGVKTKVKGKS